MLSTCFLKKMRMRERSGAQYVAGSLTWRMVCYFGIRVNTGMLNINVTLCDNDDDYSGRECRTSGGGDPERLNAPDAGRLLMTACTFHRVILPFVE